MFFFNILILRTWVVYHVHIEIRQSLVTKFLLAVNVVNLLHSNVYDKTPVLFRLTVRIEMRQSLDLLNSYLRNELSHPYNHLDDSIFIFRRIRNSFFIFITFLMNTIAPGVSSWAILLAYVPRLSLLVRKPVFGVSDQVRHKPGCTTSDTNQAVQPQKMVRGPKFWI